MKMLHVAVLLAWLPLIFERKETAKQCGTRSNLGEEETNKYMRQAVPIHLQEMKERYERSMHLDSFGCLWMPLVCLIMHLKHTPGPYSTFCKLIHLHICKLYQVVCPRTSKARCKLQIRPENYVLILFRPVATIATVPALRCAKMETA